MPDGSGRLTEEDHEKIRNWWTGRWKAPVVCPVCKTSGWTVATHVVVVHRAAPDHLVQGSPAYPFFLVTCNTCTHTMFFNAVAVGVAAPYDPAVDNTLSPNLLVDQKGD